MLRKLPSYPLFIKDPNFSLWSSSDNLNESNVTTWFSEEKRIYGFLKTKGKTYCFLGNAKDFNKPNVLKAKQLDVNVTLFSTEYIFLCGKTKLKLQFVSPLPITNLKLLSMPVTYIKYEIEGDGEISIFVNGDVCYNKTSESDKSIKAFSVDMKKYFVSCIGLQRQLLLSTNADLCQADWGYFYLSGEQSYPMDVDGFYDYVYNNKTDFCLEKADRFIGSINKKPNGIIMLGFDDIISINYFGEFLKGFYLQKYTIYDALNYVYNNIPEIEKELSAFEKRLLNKAKVHGDKYVSILNASYRQSIGAHKLVKDKKGEILFLSRECGSNSCIGTVDVSYPSMPLFLLYNTDLVKGMLRPIFKFAKMPVWKYDFAPHDVGTYPNCAGQVYGLNGVKNKIHGSYYKEDKFHIHYPIYLLPSNFDTYHFDRQMPVEESANILIMLYACYKQDKNNSLFKKEYKLCSKWVEYLIKYGLKPENQLCTDDFAGHLKNNINLAIKATVGIACYGKLLESISLDGSKYLNIAKNNAKEIMNFADKFDHLPITWDTKEDTYSLKYNLAFDKILKLKLFSKKLYDKEIAYYITKCNKYGIPLDSRNLYTKSDWTMWTATLANENIKREYFISPIYDFLLSSKDRVPFSDWYETDDGTHHHCVARTVQGGMFILLL